MDDCKALLSALPCAPDYQYDWQALYGHPRLSSLFHQMENTHQHLPWHGEDDVMAHTWMVCEALSALPAFRALPEENRQALSLAALLHDIGKIRCTRLEDGILRSPHHGAVGAQMARTLLWTEFGLSGSPAAQQFREAVCLLILHHALPLHLYEKENAETLALSVAADGELTPLFSLDALCLLCEADTLGRIASDTQENLDAIALSRQLAQEAECLSGPFSFPSAHTQRALFSGARVWPRQALYDDTWGEVILMCGLPGTGKDTWISRQHPKLPMISLDDLRKTMGVTHRDEQGRVVQAAKERAREYLRRHESFVWNATSLTSLRSQQISLFESYGARVRVVYLEAPWDVNLERNRSREAAVPESVLSAMLDKLEPPRRFEAQAVSWLAV